MRESVAEKECSRLTLASIDGGGCGRLGIGGQGSFLEDVSGGRVLEICLDLAYHWAGNGFYSFPRAEA